jgi:GNAT superfamily N-acetyltransferase
VRALRLRNAADNPVSYGATLATTEAMAEEDWRVRARRGTAADATCVVALGRRERWVGMMGAQQETDGGALLTGVWVEPDHRGRRHGVADALIGEVTAWASLHAEVLRLWVDAGVDGAPARTFYARQGFRPTGGRKPLGGGFAGEQLELARAL